MLVVRMSVTNVFLSEWLNQTTLLNLSGLLEHVHAGL